MLRAEFRFFKHLAMAGSESELKETRRTLTVGWNEIAAAVAILTDDGDASAIAPENNHARGAFGYNEGRNRDLQSIGYAP